jgi:hypothetical protein
VVNSGGRKSATEVRQTGEMGASRLAALARLISAQTMCPFAEMETVNIQQNMTQAVYLPLLGEDYARGPIEIQPGEVAGDFYYPVNDGTLPLDRVALLDVWRKSLVSFSRPRDWPLYSMLSGFSSTSPIWEEPRIYPPSKSRALEMSR